MIIRGDLFWSPLYPQRFCTGYVRKSYVHSSRDNRNESLSINWLQSSKLVDLKLLGTRHARPRGAGLAVAPPPPTFLLVVHDVKTVTSHQKESLISFFYVKNSLVLSLVKLYPLIVQLLLYSFIRNVILKLSHESTNFKIHWVWE